MTTGKAGKRGRRREAKNGFSLGGGGGRSWRRRRWRSSELCSPLLPRPEGGGAYRTHIKGVGGGGAFPHTCAGHTHTHVHTHPAREGEKRGLRWRMEDVGGRGRMRCVGKPDSARAMGECDMPPPPPPRLDCMGVCPALDLRTALTALKSYDYRSAPPSPPPFPPFPFCPPSHIAQDRPCVCVCVCASPVKTSPPSPSILPIKQEA